MKWKVPDPNSNEGHHLGRGCTRCSEEGKKTPCECKGGCTPDKECQCAKKGKCCKCCCTSCSGCKEKCKKDNWGGAMKCSCTKEETILRYRSPYEGKSGYWIEGGYTITWAQLGDTTFENRDDKLTDSGRRAYCAQILLGSVCLIWSGLTYMYWTGRNGTSSPYWNNHILDGSGLDDGSLSQWLQALGFPREMLNDKGPQNRLDKVITETFTQKLFMGFDVPKGLGNGVKDEYGNTARKPTNMHFAGFVHAIHRDSFNNDAHVFPKNGSSSADNDTNLHKRGALFKLYILSCAYFTGLQKKTPPKADNTTPKTIREILYWLSALPYSQAYPKILEHGKKELDKVAPMDSSKSLKYLSFRQSGWNKPTTVQQIDLYSHFQAVTQYCPLVLIGIQGGIHNTKGTDSTTPAIHALYANTECGFTYPTVDIQAYNQVVHYIRGLFYQLYFLRKQCAVKVTCGGKWRECRYGSGVLGKGVVSWMCLGCNPMEHDRKSRVEKVKEELKKVVPQGKDSVAAKVKDLLEKIGEVVVQLGNAQEALDRRKEDLTGVKTALNGVFPKVYPGTSGKGNNFNKVLEDVLGEVNKKVEELEKVNGLDKLNGATKKAQAALTAAQEALYGVQGMNSELDGEMGKGALEMGRLGVITAIHAPQGAILTKLDHSLRNLHGIFI